MALQITERESEGIVILELEGRITAGPEAGALREAVNALSAAGRRNLVLDFGGVDYVDSTGLGTMVVCATTLRRAGGNIRLVRVNRRNLELLVMTKLYGIFEVFNDEQDAVSSFFPDRKIQTFDILEFVNRMNAKPE